MRSKAMEPASVQSSQPGAIAGPAHADDRSHPEWTDEIILPEQLFGRATDSLGMWTGERRLLFAVLQDAVTSLYRYRSDYSFRGRRLFGETRDWFDSKEKGDLCTFEMICECLELNPGYIRQGIRRIIDSTEPDSVLLHSRPLKEKYAEGRL